MEGRRPGPARARVNRRLRRWRGRQNDIGGRRRGGRGEHGRSEAMTDAGTGNVKGGSKCTRCARIAWPPAGSRRRPRSTTCSATAATATGCGPARFGRCASRATLAARNAASSPPGKLERTANEREWTPIRPIHSRSLASIRGSTLRPKAMRMAPLRRPARPRPTSAENAAGRPQLKGQETKSWARSRHDDQSESSQAGRILTTDDTDGTASPGRSPATPVRSTDRVTQFESYIRVIGAIRGFFPLGSEQNGSPGERAGIIGRLRPLEVQSCRRWK